MVINNQFCFYLYVKINKQNKFNEIINQFNYIYIYIYNFVKMKDTQHKL